jgi:hypothetical protein
VHCRATSKKRKIFYVIDEVQEIYQVIRNVPWLHERTTAISRSGKKSMKGGKESVTSGTSLDVSGLDVDGYCTGDVLFNDYKGIKKLTEKIPKRNRWFL